MPLPKELLLGSVALAGLMGSAGIWYSYPSHQALLHDQVRVMHEKINSFEDKVGMKLNRAKDTVLEKERKLKNKINGLLGRFDKDRDGDLDLHDMDVDGDGDIDHHDLGRILADATDTCPMEIFNEHKEIVAFVAVGIAVIGVAAAIKHYLQYKHMRGISTKGKVMLTIHGCKGIHANSAHAAKPVGCLSMGSSSKIHVSVKFEKKCKAHSSTPQIKFDENPNWEFVGELAGLDLSDDRLLKIEVFGDGKNEVLGETVIDLDSEFRQHYGEERKITKPLTPHGKIEITGKFCEEKKQKPTNSKRL